MRKFLRILTSMKLALATIAYLAAAGALTTLIPQGQPHDFYFSKYPPAVAEILIRSGVTHFFDSTLFLVPAFLFLVNLSACTMSRLARELRKKEGRRFGPVILHFGMMLLVFGSVLSFATRKDGLVYLAAGEQVAMPEGRSLTLLDFTFERYADGRPKDWISRVRVAKGGKVEVDSFALRVNNPLKVGTITLYQASYGSDQLLRIKDASGTEHRLRRGESLRSGTESARFVAYEGDSGKALIRIDAEGKSRSERLGPGDTAGLFEVAGFITRETSGIQAVEDFGYPFVLVSLLVTGLGLGITLLRKIGDLKT